MRNAKCKMRNAKQEELYQHFKFRISLFIYTSSHYHISTLSLPHFHIIIATSAYYLNEPIHQAFQPFLLTTALLWFAVF